VYYWKAPGLPAWALPKEPEHEITLEQLNQLKREWKDKFAQDLQNPKELLEGFTRFVVGIVGEFPVSDYTCWTSDALYKCSQRIEKTTDPKGPDADIPM